MPQVICCNETCLEIDITPESYYNGDSMTSYCIFCKKVYLLEEDRNHSVNDFHVEEYLIGEFSIKKIYKEDEVIILNVNELQKTIIENAEDLWINSSIISKTNNNELCQYYDSYVPKENLIALQLSMQSSLFSIGDKIKLYKLAKEDKNKK